MIAGNQDIGKAFVIFEQDIKTWPVLFNQIGFQQQGFYFGIGDSDFQFSGQGDHLHQAGG